jgi:hypothetical protein
MRRVSTLARVESQRLRALRHYRQNSQIPCFRIQISLLGAKISLCRRLGKLRTNAIIMQGKFLQLYNDKSLRSENSLQNSLLAEKGSFASTYRGAIPRNEAKIFCSISTHLTEGNMFASLARISGGRRKFIEEIDRGLGVRGIVTAGRAMALVLAERSQSVQHAIAPLSGSLR